MANAAESVEASAAKPLALFASEMRDIGWSMFPQILPLAQVEAMRSDALRWIERCKHMQIKAGINEAGDGTAHHAVGGDDALDAFLHQHLFHPYLEQYFAGKPYILHAANPLYNAPHKLAYVHAIHRDTATVIPDYPFRINMLVMLNDFTLENGATQILPHSHSMLHKPSEELFNAGYHDLVGKAGSVVLFDSYLWHRGGKNTSDALRVAHTLSFGPAYIKPQMDYARMLGEERGKNFSPLSRQLLGYNARVPTSHDEWYRKKDDRLYHADQG